MVSPSKTSASKVRLTTFHVSDVFIGIFSNTHKVQLEINYHGFSINTCLYDCVSEGKDWEKTSLIFKLNTRLTFKGAADDLPRIGRFHLYFSTHSKSCERLMIIASVLTCGSMIVFLRAKIGGRRLASRMITAWRSCPW